MKDFLFNTMKKLNEFVSPSGHERAELEWVKSQISAYVPEEDIYFDKIGNLIAVMGKGAGERVMFSAHSDTIGFVVHFIDENGFLRITNLGGVNVHTLNGRQVRFSNGVNGLLHFESSEYSMAKAYIDIGVSSKEEAEKLVSIGMAASVVGEVFTMGSGDDERIVSPFLDDRIAMAIQMAAMERIAKMKFALHNELYFVFSVQEEVGIRGATTAAFGIDPTYGIALDVTGVGDIPKCFPMNMKVGGGACIKLMDSSLICSKHMVNFMRTVAEDQNIRYQMELLPYGGTDAGAMNRTRAGVYSGGISMPTRYIHTPTEEVSVADCSACVDLIVELVKAGFTFDNK